MPQEDNIMKQFDEAIKKYYKTILEADMPPQPATGAQPPAAPGGVAGVPDIGAAGGGGAGGGEMGGMDDMGNKQQPDTEMDNEVKRDADPREYTRSILALLVDNKEGVTPEMFDDFIDSVSLAITKVKDKEGIKQFYGSFYKRLQAVLELREELKSMFKQMTGTIEDLVGAQSEPDAAGGGEGKAGPTGPGVN
jgi:hypothetical protein